MCLPGACACMCVLCMCESCVCMCVFVCLMCDVAHISLSIYPDFISSLNQWVGGRGGGVEGEGGCCSFPWQRSEPC